MPRENEVKIEGEESPLVQLSRIVRAEVIRINEKEGLPFVPFEDRALIESLLKKITSDQINDPNNHKLVLDLIDTLGNTVAVHRKYMKSYNESSLTVEKIFDAFDRKVQSPIINSVLFHHIGYMKLTAESSDRSIYHFKNAIDKYMGLISMIDERKITDESFNELLTFDKKTLATLRATYQRNVINGYLDISKSDNLDGLTHQSQVGLIREGISTIKGFDSSTPEVKAVKDMILPEIKLKLLKLLELEIGGMLSQKSGINKNKDKSSKESVTKLSSEIQSFYTENLDEIKDNLSSPNPENKIRAIILLKTFIDDKDIKRSSKREPIRILENFKNTISPRDLNTLLGNVASNVKNPTEVDLISKFFAEKGFGIKVPTGDNKVTNQNKECQNKIKGFCYESQGKKVSLEKAIANTINNKRGVNDVELVDIDNLQEVASSSIRSASASRLSESTKER